MNARMTQARVHPEDVGGFQAKAFGVRRHVAAFGRDDTSSSSKARTYPASPTTSGCTAQAPRPVFLLALLPRISPNVFLGFSILSKRPAQKNAPLYYYLLTTGIILRSVGLRWRMKAPESPSSLKWRPTIWPRGSASSRRAFARCDCKSGTTPAPCGSGYHPSDRVKPSQGHSGLIG